MGKTYKVVSVALAVAAFGVGAVPAAADQPPGQAGYEGQPGNHGGGGNNGTPEGLKGYEGRPGNQGG